MSKVHTMLLSSRFVENLYRHRCMGCHRMWTSSNEDAGCDCGATAYTRSYEQVDTLERWLRHHGVSQSRYNEIENEFGKPSPICAERKVWEVSVMRYLVKTRRRKNG